MATVEQVRNLLCRHRTVQLKPMVSLPLQRLGGIDCNSGSCIGQKRTRGRTRGIKLFIKRHHCRAIKGYTVRVGFELLVNVSTALVDMYVKCSLIGIGRGPGCGFCPLVFFPPPTPDSTCHCRIIFLLVSELSISGRICKAIKQENFILATTTCLRIEWYRKEGILRLKQGKKKSATKEL
ncbi:hypothetical protein MRB53_005747 [Persea americana]|uniref:Uncharacterized protein n=1 Tax=Persea americana TaxID=3435 RepID=A0ACC2MEF7_PERAE|nr:hypothetical protein MRB53_005747 [Persea americana]